MSDTGLNTPAIKALFDINVRLGELSDWVQAAPYMMADEAAAVDVGQQILNRIRETRALGLKHMADLAKAACVPSPAVIAALEASSEDKLSGAVHGR